MKRAVILAFLIASPLHAQTIDLPKTLDIKTGRLGAIVIKSDCKSIIYDLIADGQADIFREASDDGLIHLRILPYQDGKFYLYVAGATGDKVVSAKCVVTAAGATPTPPNPPVPPIPTPPAARAVSLTFVVYQKDITASTAKVTEDAGFRQWLKDNGVSVYGISNDADLQKNPYFKGITSPSIVLQDATKTVIASDKAALMVGDVATAKVFVSKYLPAPLPPSASTAWPYPPSASYLAEVAARREEDNRRLSAPLYSGNVFNDPYINRIVENVNRK